MIDKSDTRTKRLVTLERMLMRGFVNKPVLSRVMGVSHDTIKRDIQKLKRLGSNVSYRPGKGWYATSAIFMKNRNTQRREQ